MKKILKRIGAVMVATTMLASTAVAGTWTLNVNKTSYAISNAMDKTSRNNYATIKRTDTNATVQSRTKLNVYTRCTTNSAYQSDGSSITYPSTSVNAYYTGYTEDYKGKAYKTYVKLDSTSMYSSWSSLPGSTTP